MKKTLLTLIVAGVLAVPVGAAFAEDGTPEPTAPVPTMVQPARDRDCDRTTNQDSPVIQAQERAQLRLHDGTGDQARSRDQIQLEDGTATTAGYRQGQMGNADNGRRNG